MGTKKFSCRDIFSFSNQEIVNLVDFLFDDTNLDRLAGYLYEERPSTSRTFNYRKIEVCSSYYDWAYIVKVTYLFEGLEREVTTGFLIGMEGGPGDDQIYSRDIYIQSVAGFFKTMEGQIWEKGVTDDFNIEVDFSVYLVYVGKLHTFLNNSLKVWNDQLPEDKYEWNPQLKNMFSDSPVRSFIIEEINLPELTHTNSPL
ncbi:hypothetical protein SAMN05421827_12836 [Pedobacter terrae]|uniref:Uncharacterized protein n=1 Tax=Pedobacter terrae TaxID=405671 RepID=A0A1G8D7G2_9SPHI|nr:hypothetical protein [Pedobacter terrae]SDH53687.1 hypothetical protein SAMN05421827_12836 [Pedobacter terrae]